MRLSRPRITLRRLMIAVAVVAVGMGLGVGLKRRSKYFTAVSEYHEYERCRPMQTMEPDPIAAIWPWLIWHSNLIAKYRDAARHPWLSVAPDLLEPADRPFANHRVRPN